MLLVLLLVLVSVVWYSLGSNESSTDTPEGSSIEEAIELEESRLAGVVTNVIDGDTIDVLLDNGERERVRLIGVDTPEINWQEMTSDCYGFEAKKFLTKLIKGKEVVLKTDIRQPKRDKYDRLLAYVFFDDEQEKSINQLLLEEGFARELRVGEAYTERIEFVEAESRARGLGVGLWSACTV